MGLRCLIGHEYGAPQTERDRRHRGSEVVVTVREYRECSRCGHRRITSENKEVTAGEPDEPAAATEASWSPPGDASEEAAGFAPAERTGTSGEPTSSGGTATGGGAGTAGEADHEPMSAAEDDGIILEDEADAPARGYGEWPEAEVGDEPEGEADHDPWPDEAGSPGAGSPGMGDEAAPAGATDDQAELLDAGPESTGAEAASTTGPATDEATSAADAEQPTVGVEAPDAGAEAELRLRPGDRDTELVCPDCGETWPGVNGSLRPGDICPECRGGYLDEQLIQ